MRVAIAAVKEFTKDIRGSFIVEFAVAFPLFLSLLFGIIDFGRYFFVQHTMQFATREGTRLALVGGTLKDAQGNLLSRVDSIIKDIKDNASLAVNPSDISISIFPINSDYSDPTGWANMQNAGNPGDYMRVRTQYNYKWIMLFPSNSTIQASATYRNELF